MTKLNVTMKKFDPIVLGKSREDLKKELFIEATYSQKAAKEKKDKEDNDVRKSKKHNIRIYGYKHPKVMKFLALILRCLKDCCEQRAEQLNLDMNTFLLLKNEISLAFLRNQDNIIATLKSAIRIYGTSEESNRKDTEQQEL
jgi:hypothetical protein